MTTEPAQPQALTVAALAFDCADAIGLAGFWAALLGAEVEPDESGLATVRPPGGPALDFLAVPEGKSVKNRLHLDLRGAPGGYDAAVERALQLGATRADDVYAGGDWQVLRDPEGNEFCILRSVSG